MQGLHVDLFSSTSGVVTETDDYDYGPSAPGALLRKILTTYASLGNITGFLKTVTICNGTGTSSTCTGPSGNTTGTMVTQTNNNYDETAPATTSGVAQHTSVSGSRGNLTSVNYPVSGLTSHVTYWDTGSVNTSKDINGATTTYNYTSNSASCQMAFPTGITEPLGSMTQAYTWNCTGGVLLTTTDENSKTTTYTYANDKYFWRPDSVADATGATINYCYGLLTSSAGTCTLYPTQVESTLNFNSNNSTVDKLATLDGLGRPHVRQNRQSPTATSFDSAEVDYDTLGRPSRTTLPYSGTSGQTNSGAPAVNTTYDAMSRTHTVTDAGGGTTTYGYSQNDVLMTVSPAPSGENTKQRQFEYDGLGRLTSVCEITGGTTAWPSASCGQNTAATGYLTKYAYDALGNLLTVTQNVQSSSNQQTRSYVFDAMSRLTSETNPETGSTTYTYDSDSTCTPASSGDLLKRIDAVGNTTCYAYDSLHRLTALTYPSGSYASSTPAKTFVYDSATVNGQAMANVKGRLAEAYTGPSGTKTTDLGFSYTARGEVSDVYELTPHSNSSYYHLTQSYWPHGALYQLGNNIVGLPAITYGGTIGSTVGLDGEGRITQITASSGQNPVTGVTYNTATLPTQVNFGSGDNDILAYDSNTLRMTQFKFNVGTQSQSLTGTLTWNANSSLGQLAITDQFNSPDTQTCNYSHDDLVRIASANCGSAASQAFSYDPFGNISKTGSPNSFQPTYSIATNRMTSLPGNFTPTYDANGNVTNDSNHTYSWDSDGNSVTIDSVGLTFDAIDRMVEKNSSSTYTEIVYGPSGSKLALMSGTGGQTLQKAFIALPGQATAVYTSSGLDHYRHSDWLGSARLTSSPSQAFDSSTAYAPFGESYAQYVASGTSDLSFTGQNQDTVSGDYDFLDREYSTEGRWPSPDPAGIAASDLSDPQSWNRYVYVRNRPLSSVDPYGMYCQWDDGTSDSDPFEGVGNANVQQCMEQGGTWIDPLIAPLLAAYDESQPSPGVPSAMNPNPFLGFPNLPAMFGEGPGGNDYGGFTLLDVLGCIAENDPGDSGCWGTKATIVNGLFVGSWSVDGWVNDASKSKINTAQTSSGPSPSSPFIVDTSRTLIQIGFNYFNDYPTLASASLTASQYANEYVCTALANGLSAVPSVPAGQISPGLVALEKMILKVCR
jgi:RHS repeat-associated protein